MGMGLFDDDDAPNDDLSKIEVNNEYARRFEHNKKREALQRYDELKKKGEIKESAQSDEESNSESSSEEEEEIIKGAVGSKKKDSKFFEALIKVRNQDPSLKKNDVKLFESDDESSDEETQQNVEKGKKAKYLKDVVAEQLIKDGPEFGEEDSNDEQKKKKKIKSYNEEQEEMKKAFLDAMQEIDDNDDDDDDDDEFVKVKKRNNEDEEDNESDDGEFASKLDEYFGRDTEMDQNQLFLKEFFMKKMWQDKQKTGDMMVDEEEVDELLQDEEEIERQEGYELGYNFRHEENAGDRIVGFSRKIEGTVRKKENPRKEQRKRKEERMAIAEMERKEELKHLKNLKKEEIKEKMKKVMDIAGIREDEQLLFSKKELEKEFDPDEYDKMMKAVFDEKYYAAEDEEFGSDHDEIEKPDFDKEDELLGLPKDWDVLESGDGFLAARERILKNKPESFLDDDDDAKGDNEDSEVDEDDEEEEKEEEEEEEEEETEEGKRKRKRKISIVQKAKQQMMEEFYKLDYEDTIGDLKTRFKYAQTKPNRFGLKTDEILMMDDKDLNQYVSLKKIAPYTDQEWKVPDSKRYQIKQLLRGQKSDEQKGGKKRKSDSDGKQSSRSGEKGGETTQFDESTSDMPNQDLKQGKKKRRQDLKLPPGRLIAYGKVPSKPKKNKNK